MEQILTRMREHSRRYPHRRLEVILWCDADVPMRQWGPIVGRLGEVAEEIRLAVLDVSDPHAEPNNSR